MREHTHSFQAGEAIFTEGEPADLMYVLAPLDRRRFDGVALTDSTYAIGRTSAAAFPRRSATSGVACAYLNAPL